MNRTELQRENGMLRKALADFENRINMTGGILQRASGLIVGCVADPEWLDLAYAYQHACAVLGVEPKVQIIDDEEVDDDSVVGSIGGLSISSCIIDGGVDDEEEAMPKLHIKCELSLATKRFPQAAAVTDLPVVRVEKEDDGSFTAVTNFWPYNHAGRWKQSKGAEATEAAADDKPVDTRPKDSGIEKSLVAALGDQLVKSGAFDSLVDVGEEPDYSCVYIYHSDTAFRADKSLMEASVDVKKDERRVHKVKRGRVGYDYEFVDEPGIPYHSNYPWAFVPDMPENVAALNYVTSLRKANAANTETIGEIIGRISLEKSDS